MIKTSFIVLSSFLVFSCNTKKENVINVGTETSKIINCNDTIEKLNLSFKNKDCRVFFDYFPCNYNQFINYYGYNDKEGPKPLYGVYEEHINYLFECKRCVDINDFINKIYDISKNGLWEADAPTILQDNLVLLITEYPEEIINLLSTKPKKEIESFWFFIFDGSSADDLQNKKKLKELFDVINVINPIQAKLLRSVFERMYNNRSSS